MSDLIFTKEGGCRVTVAGQPIPPELTAALRSAGLILPWEKIEGIVRYPASEQILITVKPV